MKIFKYSSPHFSERALPINSIIIHYTDMPSSKEVLAWFTDAASKVSSHYLIDEKGKIYQLVEEDKRACHAGESYWQGCTDMNSCSIGIELVNPGHSHGYRSFPKAQIRALIKLCQDIRSRWDIPRSRILGHSDVAPRRKQDPGHLFPWDQLAKEGLGLWPFVSNNRDAYKNPGLSRPLKEFALTTENVISSVAKQSNSTYSPDLIEGLAKIGYETISPQHTILAFQRHFQPHKIDGIADEETFALLHDLLKSNEKLI